MKRSGIKLRVPLYEGVPSERPEQAHPGLWYDKFCNCWSVRHGLWDLGTNKKRWIQTVTGQSGDPDQIKDSIERMMSLVTARSGTFLFMRTEGRFVTGLGQEHPVENGFTWHPTLGTAYLPGSSVKGLVRAWAEQWEQAEKNIISRIFGEEDETAPKRVGSIIFFDALPLTSIRLETDIMTPHYVPYYQNREENPPRDWYSPVPIPFLTVAEGQPFLFSIAPRKVNEAGEEDLQLVKGWLQEALEWLGAGAKTSVGYGRFVIDDAEQRKYEVQREEEKERREREATLAKMTPIEREMHADGYEEPERFMQVLTIKWLARLKEAAGTPEGKEIAERLAAWYQTNRPKDWKKPKGKNIEKVEAIKAVLYGG